MKKKALIVAGTVLATAALLTACSGGGSGSTSSKENSGASAAAVSNQVQVKYTILVVGEEDYPDVEAGREVKVSDGSGTLLGFGDLTGSGGVYTSNFKIKKSTDGFYVVTMGSRGDLNFQESDVKNGVLEVSASLGM